MNKFTDFPEQPRIMTTDEGEKYFNNMVSQIAQFQPDEIVAVARSGFSYAGWACQKLNIPDIGCYWPSHGHLVINPSSKRIVFVDDNILGGTTYKGTKLFMEKNFPSIEWTWAVLFSDWHTPEEIRNSIIQGTRLPYFAEEPMWGSKKISQDYGIRYRDE
jgi:hypoxanthine phosphoribosyltransferase